MYYFIFRENIVSESVSYWKTCWTNEQYYKINGVEKISKNIRLIIKLLKNNDVDKIPSLNQQIEMSCGMGFPTMWYVQPAKPQISLLIRPVWSEPMLVAWILYEC